MSEQSDKADFKSAIERILQRFDRALAQGAVIDFAITGGENPLEHTTRVLLIDEVLQALGWSTALAGDMLEEVRLKVGSTLFLDYVGIDPANRNPVMIIEAKAFDKPFVGRRRGRGRPRDMSDSDLIASGIAHVKRNGTEADSPVTKEWHDWLHQLSDYVRGLKDEEGHEVERVAMFSGKWLVVFENPTAIFCSAGDPDGSGILTFHAEAFVAESDEIFEHLARRKRSRSPPMPIRPTQLHAYVSRNDVHSVFHALFVKTQNTGMSLFDAEPQIYLYPVLVVKRRDGQELVVTDPGTRVSMPSKSADFGQHQESVARGAEILLQRFNQQLGTAIAPSGLVEFSGLATVASRRSKTLAGPDPTELANPRIEFLRILPAAGGEFLLVTGESPHYLLETPTVNPCQFHVWERCHAAGAAAGESVGMSREGAFFTSGENHYCAHRSIHDLRDDRCKILPIDKFTCCTACRFQTVCWRVPERAGLPCGR